ncbi:MAG: NAD(P)/FAD-dependent oxidoreductase [Burkholderiales bacterium]
MSQQIHDVLIIGEGVAGLTAAGALAKNGLKVATLEARLFGGLVINVNELDPAPDERAIAGAEFAAELMQANAELGVASIQEAATGFEDAGALKRVVTGSAAYHARQLIIASGARLKRLGIPGEAQFEGRGVSQCADCDGPLYQDQEVVVVGGGDSALQEALVLANFCSRVHLVHRGAAFRAREHFVERVDGHPKITTIWNATVEHIAGGSTVEKVCVKLGDGHKREIACAGVFAYIGLAPNSEFLPAQIERNTAGFVVTDDALQTSLPGVWAIGAVRQGYGGLLRDAALEARKVAATITARLARD